MSNLERAREALGGPTRSRDWYSIANLILLHLEAQETAAPSPTTASPSETSSAPTNGTVVRRYGSATASLDTWQTRYHLTVETGDCSKSTWYTSEEWAAIRQLFSTPPSMSESPTPSTATITDGDRGAASPEPGAPGVAASESPSRSGPECKHDFARTAGDWLSTPVCVKCGAEADVASPDAADAPSPTGSSDQVGTLGALGPFVLDAKALNPPARPQWPEPKPDEDAWSLYSAAPPLIVAPDGRALGPAGVVNYLNALYRGEVGPRDRWPS